MKTLRAILVGVLLWILIFVEISIVQIGLGIGGIFGYIVHYILLVPFGILCAQIYYMAEDQINGFILGIFMLLISIGLDLIITVPIFLESDYLGFYSDPYLWVGFIVAVLVIGIYGMGREKEVI